MRPLIILVLFFNLTPAEAQLNLVPNPSFEDTVVCPQFLGQIDAAIGWSSFRNSPDYYNGCSPVSGITTPNTSFGFQYANSGLAYAGVATYRRNISPTGNNYREYIGVELTAQLQIGTKYYFSFFAVSAEKNPIGFFSNNIGLRFFTNSYSLTNPAPLDNFAHIKLDSLLTDTVNWLKISGSFIADSNYNYISIGNFYDSQQTDTLIFNPSPDAAYYFIDDVCVTTDSLYNETWTGLQNIEPNQVQIFPNPVQDYFQFKSIHKIDEIIIYDSRGRFIKSELVNSTEGRINLGSISDGIYVALFRKEKSISVHKFFKF